MKADQYPVLIAFPINNKQVKVWCPWCKCWHTHGSGDVDCIKLTHRAEHCGNETQAQKDSPFHKTGYYLKLVTRKELEELEFGFQWGDTRGADLLESKKKK